MTCCCCAALLIPFQAHTLRVRHTMHWDTCVPPYLPLVFALTFHKSFRPSTPSWQSELYLKRARVSLTTTTAVTHAVSIPLCSQARSRHDTRGAQEPIFCGVSEPRGKTRSVFELRSVVAGFLLRSRIAAVASQLLNAKDFLARSRIAAVISSTRKCESNDCQLAHTQTQGRAHNRVLYRTSISLCGR
jgi:hypothetical protein